MEATGQRSGFFWSSGGAREQGKREKEAIQRQDTPGLTEHFDFLN